MVIYKSKLSDFTVTFPLSPKSGFFLNLTLIAILTQLPFPFRLLLLLLFCVCFLPSGFFYFVEKNVLKGKVCFEKAVGGGLWSSVLEGGACLG